MISVLLPVLFLAYDSLRSRVSLQAEVLALRHQILVLQRGNQKRRVKVSPADRLLWVWLSRLWPGWIGAQDRKTRDRDCVAPQGFSALLVLEKPTAPRSAACLRRVAGADSQNECR
jgi:hypothetical protein